jgi:hypothetical protein
MASVEYPRAFIEAVEKEYADSPHVLSALRVRDHEHLGGYLMWGYQTTSLKLEDAALIIFRGPRGIAEFFNRMRKWGCRLDLHQQWRKLHNL